MIRVWSRLGCVEEEGVIWIDLRRIIHDESDEVLYILYTSLLQLG